uniref:Uncharacterized protein n=1 Tax=Tanacetum cinerariifolium TaxID=118510 RepID=A0A699RCR1_TANCI|nr:hypothetical protein [Tanacetum cinerariifolium]
MASGQKVKASRGRKAMALVVEKKRRRKVMESVLCCGKKAKGDGYGILGVCYRIRMASGQKVKASRGRKAMALVVEKKRRRKVMESVLCCGKKAKGDGYGIVRREEVFSVTGVPVCFLYG